MLTTYPDGRPLPPGATMGLGDMDGISNLVGALLIDPTESFWFRASERYTDPTKLLQMQNEYEAVGL